MLTSRVPGISKLKLTNMRRYSSNARNSLTHVNQHGQAHMVSVSAKEPTSRQAVATAYVNASRAAIQAVHKNELVKGDALATARIAGIMATKRTSDLIPLCHNIPISKVSIDLKVEVEKSRIEIISTVECIGVTGVEMEALTSCTVTALTFYDMLKAVDKHISIDGIKVRKKTGGQSNMD